MSDPPPARSTHRPAPRRAVWELTWRCDLRCDHCLVRGGSAGAGAGELSTDEALAVADQLADLGVRLVTLTGGEPLLRADWTTIAARVRARGMALRLSTNGHLLDDVVLARLEALGAQRAVVSVDGLAGTHDRVRRGLGRRGRDSSFAMVMAALDRLAGSAVVSSVITSVTRLNLPELPAIQALLKERAVQRWSVQLAHATGRLAGAPAAWRDAVLLRPEQLEELMAFLVDAAADPALPPLVFHSIGYLGAEEPVIRPSGRRRRERFWTGCRCGVETVGIEPDGGIKGCANQVGAPFVVGSLRDEPLRAIWDDRDRWHWLDPGPEQAHGACADCALFRVCGGGCTALAHASSGHSFDNPYCVRAVRKARERA